jgi:hypothetical protein
MISRRFKVLAPLLAFSVVAAACGGDDDAAPADEPTAEDTSEATAEPTAEDTAASADGDFGGAEVTITGSERDDPSVIAINDTLNDHFGPMNLTVNFVDVGDGEVAGEDAGPGINLSFDVKP